MLLERFSDGRSHSRALINGERNNAVIIRIVNVAYKNDC